MSLLDLLNSVMNSGNQSQQFGQVVQEAPDDVLSKGLAEAFRSDQTPPMGNMVSQLFGQSNPEQRAGVLNQILGSLGPGALAGVAGTVLGGLLKPGQQQFTPEQASQVSPQQVEAMVQQAHETNPDIADQIASFYARNRGLINTLGGLAATIALTRMKDHLTNRR